MMVAGLCASGFFVASVYGQNGRSTMTPVPARPLPTLAKPFAKFSESVHALRDSVVDLAKQQIGIKYRRGASSPEHGFDCSGLAKYVMAHFNVSLPRTSREQAKVGTPLRKDVAALKPGDLLTFGKGRRISHVGIYIGNGKFVHAPSPGSPVREGSLLSDRISRWWKGARRVIAFSDTSTAPAAN